MKPITFIGVVTSVTIVTTMSFLFYDAKQKADAQDAEANKIAIEVERQITEEKELKCLATNIYHEARNEGLTGQKAIAWATLNRVKSKKYPNTICGVVYQAELKENGIPERNKCQFSWFCDGKPDTIDNQAAYNVAETIASEVINKYGKETDPTNGSFMYHAHYVKPYWASKYEKQVRIDSHIFYN